jgi:hypothetical protein
LILIFSCCSSRRNACYFPSVPVVFKEINLNLIEYSNLRFENSFVYESGGIAGLIIYRETGNDFRVFDRASPISPENPNAILYVDSNLFGLKDSVNNALFDFEGNILYGPKNCNLLRYNAAYHPPFLIIQN